MGRCYLMTLLAPEFNQAVKYQAQRLRALSFDSRMQQGVTGLTSNSDVTKDPMKVTATTPNTLAVLVNSGGAYVRGDDTQRQGLYHVVNDAPVQINIPNNTSGLPRVDIIVLQIHDYVDSTDDDNTASFRVIQGTPTVGAARNNPVGRADVPNNALLLAEVEVPNLAATIPTTNALSDRRQWAHGFFAEGGYDGQLAVAAVGGTTNMDTVTFEIGELGSRMRVRCDLRSTAYTAAGITGLYPQIQPLIGGVVTGSPVLGHERRVEGIIGSSQSTALEWEFPITTGRYSGNMKCVGRSGANSTKYMVDASVTWEEILRPSDDHNGFS